MDSLLFFNDTATTEIYTLSLHDALPIFPPTALSLSAARRSDCTMSCTETKSRLCSPSSKMRGGFPFRRRELKIATTPVYGLDRKSTRLNSSHANISYAVFCLKNTQLTAH